MIVAQELALKILKMDILGDEVRVPLATRILSGGEDAIMEIASLVATLESRTMARYSRREQSERIRRLLDEDDRLMNQSIKALAQIAERNDSEFEMTEMPML